MNPNDWPAWLTLGGHGHYVWGAYLVTLLALLTDALGARRAGRTDDPMEDER